jgi:hypothetical protein
MGEIRQHRVQILSVACPNPECSEVGVEHEAPTIILLGPGLFTRPGYVCGTCEHDMTQLPPRVVRPQFTVEEAQALVDAAGARMTELDNSTEPTVERVMLSMAVARLTEP